MRNASRICVSSLRYRRADLLFHFCSTVPLFPHPDWPVVCLAIGRTGVPLSVHLYMVMPGRFALVLFEVPLSVHPDWSVGGTSSQRILRIGSVGQVLWQWVIDCHRRHPRHLCFIYIIFFGHSLFEFEKVRAYDFVWFANFRMIY